MIASPRSHREQPRTPPRVPTSTAHMYRTPAAAGLHPWSLHDNTPASPSQDLVDHDHDHLIDQFFDFEGYYRPSRASTVDSFPYPSPPRSLPRSSPRSSPGPLMNDFITDFPAPVNDRRGNFDPYGMASSSYGPDGLSSGSDYAATPELVTGGSSPSSATSVDHYDQYGRYSAAGIQDLRYAAHDKWSNFPEDPGAVDHDYYSREQDDHHHHHRRASESTSLKRRHSGHGSEKRSRHLSDRDKTADVRKSGACLPCRVLKTSCDKSGVCPTCRKSFPDHAHLVCNRLTPGGSWPVLGKAPDVWSHYAAAEEQLCSGPRVHFGLRKDIDVYFADPRQVQWPRMRVVVQTYAHSQEGIRGEGSPKKVDFPRDEVPSHDKLQKWAEEQFEYERTTDFADAVQAFLHEYATHGHGLPKHSLVSKVHRMSCFFKILKTPYFWCRDPKNRIVTLPISAQAQLRNIARSALNGIEHDVLKKLDECLTQQGTPKAEERMAIWACLWQLMLMYREVIWATRSFIHEQGGDTESIRGAVAFDRKLMESFFPLLTMFYHYQFRMKKSIELSLDWLPSNTNPSVQRRNRILTSCLQDIDDARMDFYHQVQSSPDQVDELLATLVIEHEIKKLKARKRPSKASSRSKSSGSGSPSSRSSGSRSSGSKSSESRSSGSRSSGSGSPRSSSSGYDLPEYYGQYYG